MKLLMVKAKSAFDVHKVLTFQLTRCSLYPVSIGGTEGACYHLAFLVLTSNGKRMNIDHSTNILHYVIYYTKLLDVGCICDS